MQRNRQIGGNFFVSLQSSIKQTKPTHSLLRREQWYYKGNTSEARNWRNNEMLMWRDTLSTIVRLVIERQTTMRLMITRPRRRKG